MSMASGPINVSSIATCTAPGFVVFSVASIENWNRSIQRTQPLAKSPVSDIALDGRMEPSLWAITLICALNTGFQIHKLLTPMTMSSNVA